MVKKQPSPNKNTTNHPVKTSHMLTVIAYVKWIINHIPGYYSAQDTNITSFQPHSSPSESSHTISILHVKKLRPGKVTGVPRVTAAVPDLKFRQAGSRAPRPYFKYHGIYIELKKLYLRSHSVREGGKFFI